jgi:hypothetical protein
MKNTKFAHKIPIPLAIILTWVIIGTVLFHALEDWTWAQCFYYSVVTLTTVGYGDFSPTTDISRVIASVYILLGSTIVIGAVGYIGSNYLARKNK